MSKKEPEGNNDNVILVHKLKDEVSDEWRLIEGSLSIQVESLKRELLKKDAAMIEKDKKVRAGLTCFEF